MAKATTSVERTPEHRMRARIGLTIGRGVWSAGYKIENPEATDAERKLAWKEARKDFKKIGMKALRSLEKNDFEVIEKPAKAAA
jgi:hypothetical protein